MKRVLGTAFVSSSDAGYWEEHGGATIEAERTDVNEIRLAVKIAEAEDEFTIFMTDEEAGYLCHLLGHVILTPVS